jgi:hypothetical protein
MIVKTILVLANSVKNGGRCIAGREVRVKEGRIEPAGGWIRPVRPVIRKCKGELYWLDIRLPDNKEPRPLDVVAIPLAKQCNDPGQPENWEIVMGQPWSRVTQAPASSLHMFLEEPSGLWISNSNQTDRISVRRQQARANSPSLVLIRPSDLRIHPHSSDRKIKWRGVFRYADYDYDLKITDDAFTADALPRFPLGQVTPLTGHNLLCISLGTAFRGYRDREDQHYKLIASIIPTP